MTPGPRIAVVSGGAGAIGGAIVDALGATGHQVVVLDRTGDVACDLSSNASAVEAAKVVIERFGRCDVFVHCAGYWDAMMLHELDLSRWRDVQAVNIESGVWLAQAFAEGMATRGFGRIIFIASDAVWSPPDTASLPYVASKGAVVAVMRSLAVALGKDRIAVTAVAPGLTDTPASRVVAPAGALSAVVDRQALKRPLVPEDTANVVAFLASDGAEAMTGQLLVVDGGATKR